MPAPRDGAAYCVADGKLWVLAGYDDWFSETNTVYSYDPDTDTWGTHATLGIACAPYAHAAVIGEWIYLSSWVPMVGYRFVRYSTSSGTTETLASLPSSCEDHPCAAVGGLVYSGLGSSAPKVYDPSSNTWDDAPGTTPISGNNNYGAVITDEDSIVIAGGDWSTPTTDVYRYTPSTGAWAALPSLPVGLYSLSIASINGKIVTIGGIPGFGATNSVLVLGESSWEALDNYPIGVSAPAAGGIGDLLVVAGGYEDNPNFTAVSVAYGLSFLPDEEDDGPIAEGVVSVGTWATSLDAFGQVDIVGGVFQIDAFGLVHIPPVAFADGVGFLHTFEFDTRAVPQLPHGNPGGEE